MQNGSLILYLCITLGIIGPICNGKEKEKDPQPWWLAGCNIMYKHRHGPYFVGYGGVLCEAQKLCADLKKKRYIYNLTYISKEEVLKAQTKELGADPSEFVGVNPFVGSVELQLKADFANIDSLKWIAKELKKNAQVTEITYPQMLIDSVNKNLRKINIVLLILAVLLAIVSFSLINNSVRLSVYARRFTIRTMKLVGASWGFIRRPFLKRSITIGFIASIIACLVLAGGIYALWYYEPDVLMVITWQVMVITAASVFIFGLLITLLCSYVSVNKFLRMTAGDLYKI